jgi:hypothetical protein
MIGMTRMSQEPVLSATPEPPAGERSSFLPAILIGVVAVAVALAGLFWLNRRQTAPRPLSLSPEAAAYSAQITFSQLQLSAADNMLGANLIYLDGKVTNGGGKTVRWLRVRLHFYDTLNHVVLREDRDVISPSAAPLAPGETRDFQLRFERLPSSWNVQPPQFQIISLETP